jgi:hypothetical protein
VVRERFPVLGLMEAAVANIRVRNAGTIGGNLCFAEPHSDPATLLTALDAQLTLPRLSRNQCRRCLRMLATATDRRGRRRHRGRRRRDHDAVRRWQRRRARNGSELRPSCSESQPAASRLRDHPG